MNKANLLKFEYEKMNFSKWRAAFSMINFIENWRWIVDDGEMNSRFKSSPFLFSCNLTTGFDWEEKLAAAFRLLKKLNHLKKLFLNAAVDPLSLSLED